MRLAELKNKNIAIWGFGIEGQATAHYLAKHNIDFKVLCQQSEIIDNYVCLTNTVDGDLLDGFDVVIKSPGISPYSSLVQNTKAQMISPTALWFSNEKKTQVIAITGTKGKSTTASLLAHILKNCGKSVNLVGNIGQALISSSSDYDYIVLEASSFQIYDGAIVADIALITNLFPEHVDWHSGEENYFKDKLKILDQATIKIVNAENPTINKLIKKQDLIYFNSEDVYHVVDEKLMYGQQGIIQLSEINLIGTHNLENIGAALTVCSQLDLNRNDCIEAIKSFEPLAHRLQYLGKIGNHYAINDSIATTPIATLAAMQTQDMSQTSLFVGGYNRGNDWNSFAQSISENPPNLLFISGDNGEKIFQYLQKIKAQFDYELCDNLKQAIKQAQEITPKNHTLLLSPGAPSFDQFDSYIKRGKFFQEELKNNAKVI